MLLCQRGAMASAGIPKVRNNAQRLSTNYIFSFDRPRLRQGGMDLVKIPAALPLMGDAPRIEAVWLAEEAIRINWMRSCAELHHCLASPRAVL